MITRSKHDDEADAALQQHGLAHDWHWGEGNPFALGTTSCGGIGAG